MEKYFLQPERDAEMHILLGKLGVLVQRTMTDFGLSSVKENLSIVSYNCHGFNNGLSYVPVLLNSFDAISGFDDSVLLHG